MNFTLENHALASHDVAALLVAQRDITQVSTATDALVALRRLVAELTELDLLRRAISMADGTLWLASLGEGAHGLLQTLRTERQHAKNLLAADGAQRYRLDGVAVDQLARAEAAMRGHRTAIASAAGNRDELSLSLAAAGLADDESAPFVAARHAEFLASATAGLQSAQVRAEALTVFLRNPLRDVRHLGTELAAELAEMAATTAGLNTTAPMGEPEAKAEGSK